MKHIILGILLALAASAQTTVNGGRTYLGPQDMSGATETKTVKSGTSVPATCTVPSLFFKTDATAGRNLYFCTATNTWTQMSGSAVPGSDTYVIFNDGGTLGADSGLSYNKTFDILAVLGGLYTGNLGIDFTESDTNPGCSGGIYTIYADLSENKLKKCQNGTVTDLDTGAAADPNMVTAAGTLTSNAPMIGAGSKAAAVGTRSGNTTEFATISGTKTASRQATFDASGNIVASAYDVGAADTQLQTTVSSPTATVATGVAACLHSSGYYSSQVVASGTVTKSSGSETGEVKIGWQCSGGAPILVARLATGLTLGNFSCTNVTCTSSNAWAEDDHQIATVQMSSGTMGTLVDLRAKGTDTTWIPGTGLSRSGSTWSAVVPYKACTLVVGADNASAALVNGDLAQARQCFIPYAATVIEVVVAADGGTPSVITGRNRAGTVSNLVSSALATAASGGLACSRASAVTGLSGATCSATLQNTTLQAGDWFDLVSGTAGGTAKRMSISIIWQ